MTTAATTTIAAMVHHSQPWLVTGRDGWDTVMTGAPGVVAAAEATAVAGGAAVGEIDQAVEAVTAAFGDRTPDKARLAGAIKAAYAEAP